MPDQDYNQLSDEQLLSIAAQDPALKQQVAMGYFQSKGWAPHQAAGIVGNLWHESGGDTGATGDSGASKYLAQWQGPRLEAYHKFAQEKGSKPEDFYTQLQFVQNELEGSEKGAGDALRSTANYKQATEAFSKLYERPGKPMMESRLSQAAKLLSLGEAEAAELAPAKDLSKMGNEELAKIAGVELPKTTVAAKTKELEKGKPSGLCKGSNCGDAVANDLNPKFEAAGLPKLETGGLGINTPKRMAEETGSKLYDNRETPFTADVLAAMPDDTFMVAGTGGEDSHAQKTGRNPETGERGVISWNKEQGTYWETYEDAARKIANGKWSNWTATAPLSGKDEGRDLSKMTNAELAKIAGIQLTPTKEGGIWIGLKEGMARFVTTAARYVDPESAMTGMGVMPNEETRELLKAAPQSSEARAQVASQAMTQGLFPNGVPPESKGYIDWIPRRLASMWPELVMLSTLSVAAGPAELMEAGLWQTMIQGAVPFGFTEALMSDNPFTGMAKGTLFGATLGAGKYFTGLIPNALVKWGSRVGGGYALGAGAAYAEGASPEEMRRQGLLFALFEAVGIRDKDKPKAANSVTDDFMNHLQEVADHIEDAKAKQTPGTAEWLKSQETITPITDVEKAGTYETPGAFFETPSALSKEVMQRAAEERQAGIKKEFGPEEDARILGEAAKARQFEIDKAEKAEAARDWEQHLNEQRERYEADRAAARAAGQPDPSVPSTPREVRSEADQIIEDFRGGEDNDLLNFIPEEELARIRGGQQPSLELSDELHEKLSGYRQQYEIDKRNAQTKMYSGGPDSMEIFRKLVPNADQVIEDAKKWLADKYGIAADMLKPIGVMKGAKDKDLLQFNVTDPNHERFNSMLSAAVPKPTEELRYGGGPDTSSWFREIWDNLTKTPPVGRPSESKMSGIKKMYEGARSYLAPETAGGGAMPTAEEFVSQISQAKRQADIGARNLINYRYAFKQMGYDAAYKLAAKMERGEKVPTEWQGYTRALKEAFDTSHKEIDKIKEGDVGYLENYASHLCADPEKAKRYFATELAKIPLEGRKGFLLRRILSDYDRMRANGIEPLFENPAQQSIAGLMEQWRYIGANWFMDGLNKKGWFIPEGKDGNPARPVPEGWLQTDSRVFRKGWAPKEVLDVVYNHLIPSKGNTAYERYGSLMNMWNAMHVTLSAFHGVTTTAHAFSFGPAKAIPEFIGAVMSGDNAKASNALKLLSRLSIPNLWKASKIGEEVYFEPGKHKHGPGWDKLVDLSVAGGASPREMSILGGFAAESFKELALQLRGGEFGQSFRSMMHLAGKPIMNGVVRRLKWGSTLVRNQIALEKLQDKYEKQYGKPHTWKPETHGDFAKNSGTLAYNEREFSDKIFGQIDPDNIHWNRAFNRLLKGIIAYPGWNKGTFGWMAGMLRGGFKLATGKPLDLQAKHSLEFGMGLFITNALANTIMHMALNNGQSPEDWKDVLIGARTGRYLNNGAPERVNIASYMKDIMAMAPTPDKPFRGFKAIESKLQAPFQMFVELRENADYFGTEIMPSKGNALEKLGGLGGYLAGKAAPFGFSSYMTGKSAITQYGGFVGLRPVSRYMSNTDAMNRIDEILHAQSPKTRTAEETGTSRLQADLKELGWGGQMDEMEAGIDKAREEGKLTAIQAKNIRQAVQEDKRVVQFKKLRNLGDTLEVYAQGNEAERTLWQPFLMQKWIRATPEKKGQFEDEYERALGLSTMDEAPPRIPPEMVPEAPPKQVPPKQAKKFSILGQ